MKASPATSATFLCVSLFLGLAVPLCFWPFRPGATALLGLGIYSVICLGLSVELCELALALIWNAPLLPATDSVRDRRRVAVLMTVCDDADPDHLLALQPIADAGYQVFILDDSGTPARIPQIVAGSAVVMRRATREGAKAGNVNNWLRVHGELFEHCILLDSDSLMSTFAADALVRAADHPANTMIGIFQATAFPHSIGPPTWLQRVLSVGTSIRNRIFARVHTRLGMLLSFGHNQLIRLSAMRAVGGLDERWSSEDTVLSLRMAASGFGVALVDARTYDTDPRTLSRYLRRTVRWARQTVELFAFDWRSVPLRYKLVLCWHLLSYVMPLLATALLLLSLWKSQAAPRIVVDFTIAALRFDSGYQAYGLAIWPGILAVFVRVGMATAIAVVEGAGIGGRVRAAILGGSIQAFVLLPMALGMLASALGKMVPFEPTNSRQASRSRLLLAVGGCGALCLFAAVVLGLIIHPGAALVGMNGIWCLGLLGAPVVLVVSALEGRGGPTRRGVICSGMGANGFAERAWPSADGPDHAAVPRPLRRETFGGD